jgi:hypothetical protein
MQRESASRGEKDRQKENERSNEAVCVQLKKACYTAAIQSEAKPTLHQEEKEQRSRIYCGRSRRRCFRSEEESYSSETANKLEELFELSHMEMRLTNMVLIVRRKILRQ